ncbi:MAG: zinc-dependent alcohol dehydrogenase family protein [Planctomyces sp.]|nr:zinc-dependent alcohol dehydrogenase family protein [Planctomyces sp.]
MKAIQFSDPGEPVDVLKCVSLDKPKPGPGEVLVRMIAAPVNPSDLMYIRGSYTVPANCPASPGFEGVGIVESSGGGLRGKLFTGKRVVVANRKGGNWAEYTVVPADQVIPVNNGLSDEQAATFLVNPATAWVMTQEVLKVGRGEWLLQTAAASSLGQMIVRLGKHVGFRTLNVVRREEHAATLKSLGADSVIVFDGSKDAPEKLQQAVFQATGEKTVKKAIDAVGGTTGSAVIQSLGPRGHLLVYGTLSNQPLVFSPRTLMTHGSTVEGFWLGIHMAEKTLPGKLMLIRKITQLIKSGVLGSSIRKTFPLEQVTDAVREAENSQQGKVLLKIS